MSDVRTVGLVVHFGRPAAVAAAAATAATLHAVGVAVHVADTDVAEGEAPPDWPGVRLVEHAGFADGLDVALSFGGDGTFLRAAHRCRDAGVPVLGVNLGRVGFLAEVEVGDLDAALDRLLAGTWRVEERMTIEAVVEDPEGNELAREWALNDVSVEKTARQRVLLMELHVGDQPFAEIPADALVLATPTGSTAYALSAGGPILSPRVAATLVTPVAPHSLFDRTLVVAPDEVVRVHVLPDQAPAVLSVDGRDPVHVPAGGAVLATGGAQPVRLVRLDPPDFYQLVRRKFSLR
jgi:NAD+ kinase